MTFQPFTCFHIFFWSVVSDSEDTDADVHDDDEVHDDDDDEEQSQYFLHD